MSSLTTTRIFGNPVRPTQWGGYFFDLLFVFFLWLSYASLQDLHAFASGARTVSVPASSMNTKTESLTRPPGYAPRGTSAGLFSYAMLGVGVPFAVMQSLVPVLANGLDIGLGSILPVLGFAMILTLVMALGLHKRHLWFVRYMFAVSTLLLVGYGLGVLLSLAILSGVVPIKHPDWHFMSIVNIVYWAIQALFVGFLLRMLRLHYWQPWTKPNTWEPRNESPPRWGMSHNNASPPKQ